MSELLTVGKLRKMLVGLNLPDSAEVSLKIEHDDGIEDETHVICVEVELFGDHPRIVLS